MNETIVSLSELFHKNTRKFMIESIPTNSKHEKTARKLLNNILLEYPQWYSCIAALTIYPIQMWAITARENIGIDKLRLIEIIEDHSSYFGIPAGGRFTNQLASLEQTDAEIKLVRKILDNEDKLLDNKHLQVLKSIHDPGSDTVSKYYVDTHYESAVIEICKKYNSDFNEINSRLIEELTYDDSENVFHNMDLMIRQLPAIKEMEKDKHSEINYKDTYQTIIRCIESLYDYDIDGKTMESITMKYAKGKREYVIASEMGKSRNYVRQKYNTAIEILSYLIWGYSTQEIINSYQKKKK